MSVVEFSSPVQPGKTKIRLSRKKGEIEADVAKDVGLCTGYRCLPFQKIDFRNLSEIRPNMDEIGSKMGRMFMSAKDRHHKQNETQSFDPFFNLLETIQILFVKFIKKPRVAEHLVLEEKAKSHRTGSDSPKVDMVLKIEGLYSIGGMETLKVSWVDSHVGERMMAEGTMPPDYLDRLFENVSEIMSGGKHCVRVSKEELFLLRKLLELNTDRTVQPPYLRGDPCRSLSFIQPIFRRNSQEQEMKKMQNNPQSDLPDCLRDIQFVRDFGMKDSHESEALMRRMRAGLAMLQPFRNDLHNFDQVAAYSDLAASLSGTSRTAEKSKHTSANPTSSTGPSTTNNCANCGRTMGKKMWCSRCKTTFYCDQTCQKAHWKEHKGECQRKL